VNLVEGGGWTQFNKKLTPVKHLKQCVALKEVSIFSLNIRLNLNNILPRMVENFEIPLVCSNMSLLVICSNVAFVNMQYQESILNNTLG
jgi:hypothetical protein